MLTAGTWTKEMPAPLSFDSNGVWTLKACSSTGELNGNFATGFSRCRIE